MKWDDFLEAAKKIVADHRAEYAAEYYMKGGLFGNPGKAIAGVFSDPLNALGSVADSPIVTSALSLLPFAGPAVAGLSEAGGKLLQGESLGQAAERGLMTAGEGYIGSAAGSALGGSLGSAAGDEIGNGVADSASNLYSGSLAQQGVDGISNGIGDLYSGSALQDAVGGISSLTNGLSGIGGDISGGVSNLYNGSDLQSGVNSVQNALGYGGSATTDPTVSAARDAASAAASAPSSIQPLTGANVASGASNVGGGGTGGFVSGAAGGAGDISGGSGGFANAPGVSSDFSLGSQPDITTAGSLSTPNTVPQDFASSAQSLATPTAASGGKSMLSQLTPYLPLASGLLKAGIGGAATNTNQAGYAGENAAAQQAAAAYQPFLQNSTAANNTLANLYGTNGQAAETAAQQNFQNTPGYQFQLQQGVNALDASAASRGQLLSGNQQKALTDYGQGLAGTQYQQYVANLQNQAAQGIPAANGYGNSIYTGANALAQGGAAAAANQNTTSSGLLSALFPTNTNNGILSPNILASLFGSSNG